MPSIREQMREIQNKLYVLSLENKEVKTVNLLSRPELEVYLDNWNDLIEKSRNDEISQEIKQLAIDIKEAEQKLENLIDLKQLAHWTKIFQEKESRRKALSTQKQLELQKLEKGRLPYKLRSDLFKLNDIQRKIVQASGGGDCPFNTLALAFAAEVLSPDGHFNQPTIKSNTKKLDKDFGKFLQAFGEFHKDFKVQTWDEFTQWLNHYNNPKDIEKLLTPVFRKYYAEYILPDQHDKMFSIFQNETTSFVNTYNIVKSDIQSPFEVLQAKFNHLSQQSSGLTPKQVINEIKKLDEYKQLLNLSYGSHSRSKCKITNYQIMQVLKSKISIDDLAIDICHRTSLNNEFTELFDGGVRVLDQDLKKLVTSDEYDRTTILKNMWQEKAWPTYQKAVSLPHAMNSEAMEQIANELLNANLATENRDQLQLKDQLFSSSDEYDYTLSALNKDMHWVPIIEDKMLVESWQRTPREVRYNEVKAIEHYSSNGLEHPIKKKKTSLSVFKNLEQTSSTPTVFSTYGVRARVATVFKPSAQDILLEDLSVFYGKKSISTEYSNRCVLRL